MIKPPKLAVIEGGKDDVPITKPDGKPPGGPDWLRRLNVEDRFLTRPKSQPNSVVLQNYGVAQITTEAILLYDLTGNTPSPFIWVDSANFSQQNVLVGILPAAEVSNGRNHLLVSEPRQVHDGHEGPSEDLPEG